MQRPNAQLTRLVAFAACMFLLLWLSACHQLRPLDGTGSLDCDDCGGHARVCERPTVRALAHDLDVLEEHIERYGSVVTKQPSVWGQARMTKHREEFEKQMYAQINTFTETLQGSVAESDQAYFADAFALGAAAAAANSGGRSTGGSTSSATTSAAPATTAPGTTTTTKTTATPAGTTTTSQNVAPLGTSDPTTLIPDQSSTFEAFNNVSRTAVTTRTGPAYTFVNGGAIQLEPTVLLDQRARFINHLHELRRINEGDDTGDSPGYALNLIRIPVSILPGKCTDVGHGAEVTMTISPYLSDELLPTTFRNLIANDVLDEIDFPVTQFINDPSNLVYFDPVRANDMDKLVEYVEAGKAANYYAPDKAKKFRWRPSLQKVIERPEWSWLRDLADGVGDREDDPEPETALGQNAPAQKARSGAQNPRQTTFTGRARRAFSAQFTNGASRSSPGTKSRQAQLPFPRSQFIEVYGLEFVRSIDAEVYRAMQADKTSRPCPDSSQLWIHLPDVRAFLQDEVAAAHKFLAEPTNMDLWRFCAPELAQAIRSHQDQQLAVLRQHFKNAMMTKTLDNRPPRDMFTALTWAIIVEAALLTDQLISDMRESAAARGCACVNPGWLDYYLPNPSAEARKAFNEYVQCRWPIHVFALDPAAQQQNIMDIFSGRREMQLAMSLAFVSGQISSRNMMQYARRIEYDLATVDLNGTAIGFSHGENVFGWRFYPRFQTPDIESNLTVFGRDLLWGGPNRNTLLRQRRLEPGLRECVAIVIMPSFVPYATLDVSSNWFSLTNPKCKVMNSADAMRLSKSVRTIENCAGKVADADCYRAGDFPLLLQKAKQLSARLPLQSTKVQIPYENTLGGFAMFNVGVTDLAPELVGWYGCTAINATQPTTIFLAGNHFSVHQTRVIAGGIECTATEMLSRQVMKVTVPAGAQQIGDGCLKFVDIRVATPYGTTQPLLIPVCEPPAATAAKGITWSSPTLQVAFSYGNVGIVPPAAGTNTQNYSPQTLTIKKGDINTNKYTTVDVTLKFDASLGVDPIVLSAVPYDAKQEAYAVPVAQLVQKLLGAFAAKFGPEATNPPCQLVITAAPLQFNDVNGGPAVLRTVANTLTIIWLKAAASQPKTNSSAATDAPATATAASAVQQAATTTSARFGAATSEQAPIAPAVGSSPAVAASAAPVSQPTRASLLAPLGGRTPAPPR